MPTTTTFANELKATNYASSPKSGSGYAATDLIQLYANDGTPNGKISRSDLMSCVKDSLGSLLNGGTAQTTGITKVPSLVGNALGATTVANLASVLGGIIPRGNISAMKTENADSIGEEAQAVSVNGNGVSKGFPSNYGFSFSFKTTGDYRYVQFFYSPNVGLYVRYNGFGTTWNGWQRIALTNA